MISFSICFTITGKKNYIRTRQEAGRYWEMQSFFKQRTLRWEVCDEKHLGRGSVRLQAGSGPTATAGCSAASRPGCRHTAVKVQNRIKWNRKEGDRGKAF